MSRESRSASSAMISRASCWRAGSCARPSWSVSTNIRMEVRGVRRSWETLLTKSVWSRARRASRRTETMAKIPPITVVATMATTSQPKTKSRPREPKTRIRMPMARSAAAGTKTNPMMIPRMRESFTEASYPGADRGQMSSLEGAAARQGRAAPPLLRAEGARLGGVLGPAPSSTAAPSARIAYGGS